MPKYNGGFIGTDGLDAPDPPTAVTPTAGASEVSVAFTAPTDTGTSAITGFVAQVSTNGTDYSAGSNTGSSSPIVVSSLTNDTAYTAKVWAINAYGTSAPSDASSSFTPTLPLRALIIGGIGGSDAPQNIVDFVEFSSLGNATDFGDLSTNRYGAGCTGSSTRTLAAGGRNALGNGNEQASIDYFSIASAGNASDFGDLTNDRYFMAATASSTRAVFIGGEESGTPQNTMDYVTIANTGNATDFGDVSVRSSQGSGCGSSTRGLHGGGKNLSNTTVDVVEYITIANTGNSTDFGDLSSARRYVGACSNSTRALFAGGDQTVGGDTDTIDYFTIASTGNSTDFGNLVANRNGLAGAASSTVGCFFGGVSAYSNVMQKVTIGSTGNASDFGDLTFARGYLGAASNAHGGL